MDNKCGVENIQNTGSCVELQQKVWTAEAGAKPDTIDWNGKIRESIRNRVQSRLFLIATIFLTIATVPFIAIPGLCPLVWMAAGLWIMYVQANRNDGKIGDLGLRFLMIGQYFNFALGVVGALVSFVLIVDGCTAISAGYTPEKEYMHLINSLFWCSFLALGVTFLLAGLRWKLVCAVRTIKDAYEGTVNDGMIPVSAVVVCYVLGVAACLSVVGIFIGIAAILFGILLAKYRNDVIKLNVDML